LQHPKAYMAHAFTKSPIACDPAGDVPHSDVPSALKGPRLITNQGMKLPDCLGVKHLPRTWPSCAGLSDDPKDGRSSVWEL